MAFKVGYHFSMVGIKETESLATFVHHTTLHENIDGRIM